MRILSLVFGLLLLATTAHAETYPTRPIALLVPAAAGGGNDTVARVVAEKMGRILGQQIVVENRPGAGGSLAARARAGSVGHRLSLAG